MALTSIRFHGPSSVGLAVISIIYRPIYQKNQFLGIFVAIFGKENTAKTQTRLWGKQRVYL